MVHEKCPTCRKLLSKAGVCPSCGRGKIMGIHAGQRGSTNTGDKFLKKVMKAAKGR